MVHKEVDGGTRAEYGDFKRLVREPLPYAPEMVVEKWRSSATGLTVLWADFESPLLNAYISVATEIFNDSGVPHTLEHLVFLGSKEYPYKGVLDSLANRAFAQGTNAWTANDHTAYTLTTAGAEGFLRMLPVYCDHVFFPTLTHAGFVTEVYHINKKLEDAGVVFSEMQGRENTGADLMELKTQRMLYPRSSGYRSETGGLMSALRVLTIDEIRAYHGTYYAPHNAALVVCGRIDPAGLFAALAPVEQRLIALLGADADGPPGWRRPFLETPSAVPPVIDGTQLAMDGVDDADAPAPGTTADPLRRRVFIDFPETDESVGDVQISWVGPKLDAVLELQALDLLGTYLTDSTVSPLQKAFVEQAQPLCSDVYLGTTERAGATVIGASFSSVPAAQLDTLDKQLDTLLHTLAADGLDMHRMAVVLRRERQRLMSQLETRPADCFSDVLIHEFLYGKQDGSELRVSLDDMRRFDVLDTYTSDDWVRVLRANLIDNARLVVVGRPSAALARKLKADKRALVAERRATLGPDAGARFDEELRDARSENDRPIPPGLLERFPIPSGASIEWITVATATSGEHTSGVPQRAEMPTVMDTRVSQHVLTDGEAPPFQIQFDHVHSKFVVLTLVFGTEAVPQTLRPYMTLYLSMLFALPITRLDTQERLTYEEVVHALDNDVLEYDAAIGLGSSFAENVAIEMKVEAHQYETAVTWLRDLLWGSEFDVERVRVAVAKLAQSLPEQKRDGRAVAWALSRLLLYSEADSTCLANSILAQSRHVPEMQTKIAEQPAQVVETLEHIRHTLLRPDSLRVSVAGDILALRAPRAPWMHKFALPEWQGTPARPVALPWARDVTNALGKAPAVQGRICALPTIESSYAVFTARGIRDYCDADYAALVVTITVLNAMESFLWRFIRGAGLAYGASIRSDPEAQHIHFILYRAPDSAKAFVEGRRVIQALASDGVLDDGTVVRVDATTLESAKSSLHFSVADSEGTVGAAALESFLDTAIKRVGKGRGHRLLQHANAVSLADVQACLRKYILPLFDASSSVCTVACSPATLEPIETELRALGYHMERAEIPVSAADTGALGSDAASSAGGEDGSDGEEGEEGEAGEQSDFSDSASESDTDSGDDD
ncbi:hypothetical protein MSPP1_000901 [Malassezia sp. CBS 17886]|nr:hypothetical protein MSPP1_000901 [Malassezia sp. CBS 17886]